jgi:hypothetical protein
MEASEAVSGPKRGGDEDKAGEGGRGMIHPSREQRKDHGSAWTSVRYTRNAKSGYSALRSGTVRAWWVDPAACGIPTGSGSGSHVSRSCAVP